MKNLSRSAAALGTLMASALIAPSAFAVDEGTVVSAVRDRQVAYVPYTDLNLQDAKGLDRLRTRVRTASRVVCNVNSVYSLAERIEAQACSRSAIDDAEVQIARLLSSGATAVAASGSITVAAR